MFDLFFNEDTVANGLQDDAANNFAQLLNKLVYEEHLSMDEAVKRIMENRSYRTDK